MTLAVLVLFLAGAADPARPAPGHPALAKADAAFKQQNWKDAAVLYREVLAGRPTADEAWRASLQLSLSSLRLGEYDAAVEALQSASTRFRGTVREARAERLLGNLYLTLPHWGTEMGGKFYRNRRDQGIWKHTYALDRKKAVASLERARELYISLLAHPERLKDLPRAEAENLWKERLDAQFDLVAAVTRFGPYDANWSYWWYAWEEMDETEDGTVDEDHGLSRGGGGPWALQQQGRPNGIPVDAEGKPIWDPVPTAYRPDLPSGQKMKYLLHEIERLDRGDTREYAALAVYRRAILARARYGSERLQRFAGWWDGNSQPYQEELEKKRLYELADNEVLTLLGTRLAVVKLPADEDIIGLLRTVAARYPKAEIAGEAQYALGVTYQSREQYKKALDEYLQYREMFPRGARLEAVRRQEAIIKKPEAGIEQLGVQLAGDPATLSLTHRNVRTIHFRAYTLDLAAYLNDALERMRKDEDDRRGYYYDLGNPSHALLHNRGQDGQPLYRKYLGKLVAEWDSAVPDDGTHRYATTRVTTPLKDRGCRLIEATVEGGGGPSRNIVLLQDLALVEKAYKGQALHFVCDARTGEPIGGAKMQYFQFWHRYEKQGAEKRERSHWHVSEKMQNTDDAGISLFTSETRFNGQRPQVITIARVGEDRLAFAGVNHWSQYYHPSRQWSGRRAALFTDRPVYRPGQTVRAKLWCRTYQNGEYQPSARETLTVEVRDPKGKVVLNRRVTLDEYGGAEFDLALEGRPPLGLYSISVENAQCAGNQFRVEEYKKPEYEVTVEPTTDLARLGDKVSGVIRARYYFGAPVTNATVKYRIYREEFTFSHTEPGPWDWLYGAGYGLVCYDYPWFPGWRNWNCRPAIWYPWWGPAPKRARELVGEGEARISEDGTAKFTVDTAPAKEAHPDKDHIYTIEAEVRDASRRVIEGRGQVKVARQGVYAFVSVDRGYYQPGQQVSVTVRTLTAASKPVAVKGKVIVARVRYTGENNARVLEEAEQTWNAETDADGKLTFPLKAGKSGQYKIAFETKDAGGTPVQGAALIWVAGADFDGRIYRFADLEILTDKREYAPGEVAHLMINVARAGATVLFSHHMDGGALTNYRVIPVPRRSTTVDVPIGKGDVPNFFVEATAVYDGRVHQEMREVCVPPKEGMLNLDIRTDKAEYRPGEKGRVLVTATTPDGKPVKTQVAITAFDKSVLYIQPEFTPDLRAHYWGQKRYGNLQMASNLAWTFQGERNLEDPQSRVQWGDMVPREWGGSWGKRWVNWATDEVPDLENMAGPGGGAVLSRRKMSAAEDMVMANGAVPPASPQAAAMVAEVPSDAAKQQGGRQEAGGGAGAPAYQEAQVRTQFADTALWLAALETGEDGKASAEITFPENLTGWKVRALGMSRETRVGDGDAAAVTSKNLLVRLQAPRFFMERDRVMLTANVHNYLKTAKRARVTLALPAGRVGSPLQILGQPTVQVDVPAGGEQQVNWEVAVLREGTAVVKAEALTDEESDAMQMSFPALVHGIEKTVSTTGSLPRSGKHVAEVTLDIPAQRNPSASRLEVRFSPSLAGAIIDALPYLLDYPYGCTEQTMSRFLPAVMVQRTLQQMGVNLEELERRRTNLNAQQLGTAAERAKAYQRPGRDPIFNTAALNKIVADSLERLYDAQQPDGGWGWWKGDRSSTYLTAYVVWGLQLAAENDVKVDADRLNRGFQALQHNIQTDLKDWKEGRGAANDQAFLAYVLSLRKLKNDELNALLFERRIHLSLYGKALLSLALRNAGDAAKADLVLRNIRQQEKQDDENQTTWFETNKAGWWCWWNNDIETNAWILKAIVAANPKDPAAPRLVKWLLNNRSNGYYWRSTRDTAICASVFVDYMRAVGEDRPDYTVRVLYDGKPMKDVKITPENFLSFDNQFALSGDALTSGKHKLQITRIGDGALYFNTYLTYFTKEDNIKAAGLEIKVDRKYYRMERADREETVKGSRLQEVKEQRVRYRRVPLKDGDTLKSGDLVEVELRLTSKNDYDYLIFEDMKAAGLEPVEVRSGAHYGELCSNMELRDEKVAFFITSLTQGEHLIQYRMRAEIPGTFHALPTKGWAMYAPELRANSDEMTLKVMDR